MSHTQSAVQYSAVLYSLSMQDCMRGVLVGYRQEAVVDGQGHVLLVGVERVQHLPRVLELASLAVHSEQPPVCGHPQAHPLGRQLGL